jgi:hypothetical protein
VSKRVLVGLALLWASSNAALAQPAPGPDASAARARARALAQEGAEHYAQGDYQAALQKFEEAYATFATPRLLFNLGLAYRGLAREVEAIEAFERFIAQAPDAPEDSRAEAASATAELRKRVGSVEIVCNLDGAEVTIDGRSVGRTPIEREILVAAGTHQVVLERPGAELFLQRITAAPGEVVRVDARMAPAGPARPGAAAAGVSDAVTRGDAEAAGSAEPAGRPVYRRWWFWTAAAAVAGGAAAAFALSRPARAPASASLGTATVP